MSAASSSSDAPRCPIDHSAMSRDAWTSLNINTASPQPVDESAHHHFHIPPPTIIQPIIDGLNVHTIHHHTLPVPEIVRTPQQFTTDNAPTTHPLACDSATIHGAAPPDTVGDIFPDAKPHPDQRLPLPTTAIPSNIPRGGIDPQTNRPYDGTWTFPSPQRFYNAMTKKGWSPNERDMQTIVSIHNAVNERAWYQVLQYEKLHAATCPTPKLVKFRGRPDDLSVKARFMSLFGYTKPFDRHDWIVDRCGDQVTYVIDFYQGHEKPGLPAAASMHIDARPYPTIAGIWDRIRMSL